ncbi:MULTISPECIES: InlB B-repeat-containing protein, partial [unclassified Enterococcus]|uniref:InlB B-repeat-containing protein n=1 Tax=unclassified Enterococcus TaxID=2608891 RepID=UPI00155463AB
PATATVYLGDDYLISNKTPTREGHVFTGWRQAETETAYQPKDTISEVSANIVLVAQWQLQYAIRYQTGTGDAVLGLPAGTTVLAGTTYPISTELPARVGYDFSGWQADDAAKTIYQPGASIVNVQAHITLTAQWSKPLKVSYAKGTSDLVIGLPPQATVRVGFDYQIPATEAPARIGYVFTGWQADDAAQTIYQAADTLEKLSRDTVLTAQWRKQYLIRYAKGTG